MIPLRDRPRLMRVWRAVRHPVRWAGHGPYRAGGTVLAVLVAVTVFSDVSRHHSTHRRPSTVAAPGFEITVPPTATTTTVAAPATTTVPPTTAAVTLTLAPAAKAAAVQFVTVWASHTPTGLWHQRLDALATPQLAAGFAHTLPSAVPAGTRIDGPVVGNSDSGGGTVVVPVLEGGQHAEVSVILTFAGGVWKVNSFE
jgi:hypothetical protein